MPSRAAVNLARETGVEVTVGGIETRRQYDTIVALKPDRLQEYALGRPVDAAAFSNRSGLPLRHQAANAADATRMALPA